MYLYLLYSLVRNIRRNSINKFTSFLQNVHSDENQILNRLINRRVRPREENRRPADVVQEEPTVRSNLLNWLIVIQLMCNSLNINYFLHCFRRKS